MEQEKNSEAAPLGYLPYTPTLLFGLYLTVSSAAGKTPLLYCSSLCGDQFDFFILLYGILSAIFLINHALFYWILSWYAAKKKERAGVWKSYS